MLPRATDLPATSARVRTIKRLCVTLRTFALGTALACEPAPHAKTVQAAPVTDAALKSTPAATARTNAGFRSQQRLSEHYAKHSAEFGEISRDEYLRRAQALRDAPASGDVLEIRRDDGTVSRFDRTSGAFIAFDADGTIRTFFRPNDGEAYFQRQARRRSD